MKITKHLLTTFFASAVLLGVHSVNAEEHAKHHEASDVTATQSNTSAALKTMQAQLDSVDKDLTVGNLKHIHAYAEAINKAIEGVDKDPTLDETKQKRVAGYVKNIAKLTDTMHDNADMKKLPETKKAAEKLKAQAGLLVKQFKKGK